MPTAPDQFEPVLEPAHWAHQRRAFALSKDRADFALFMEQRTGKTRVILDTAAYLYHQGKIDALIVLAPAGVHRDWAVEAVPSYLPEWTQYKALVWNSGKAGNKGEEENRKSLVGHQGLSVACLNIDSLLTDRARGFLRLLTAKRKALCVVDESSIIKTPGVKRTKLAIALGRRCHYRRILDGTPVTQGPLDLYSQCAFLSYDLLGFHSFYAFKARYGVWEQRVNQGTGQRYDVLKEYQNLDELTMKLDRFSFRVTRSEVFDLPPKVYGKARFELSKRQREVYDSLRETYIAELSAGTFTVANVLTRYLRLQQVASNFWPGEDVAEICPQCGGAGCPACKELGLVPIHQAAQRIDARNPRLAAALGEVKRFSEPFIIWARFHQELDDIEGALAGAGITFVRYDGTLGQDERAENKAAFQRGDAQGFLSNTQAGARGLKLSRARHMLYYSNNFSLLLRAQSEDRPIMDGQDKSLEIIDLVANDTVDERILEALRLKRKIADMIVRDKPQEWL